MKDFSYLLNRKIKNIEKVKGNLDDLCFKPFTYYKGSGNEKVILNKVSRYFNKKIKCYFHINKIFKYRHLHTKIIDKETCYIYGFILVANKSILENQNFRLKSHLYPPDFVNRFHNQRGCCIIGYGFDNRVIDKSFIEDVMDSLWFCFCHYYDLKSPIDDSKLIFDYIWFDCPTDKLDYLQNYCKMDCLEHNPNLLYRFTERGF